MDLSVEFSEEESASEAVNEISSKLNVEKPELVYVFASYSYDMGKVAEKLNNEFEDTVIVGCSSAVEVTSEGVHEESLTVAVFEDVEVGVGIGKNIGNDSYEAGMSAVKEAAEEIDVIDAKEDGINIDPLKKESTIVNVFSDPLNGVGVEILNAINDYLGAGFNVAGQFAADNLDFEQTFVTINNEVYDDAVIVSMIDTSENVGLNKAHGFEPMPQEFNVEESSGNIVERLGEKRPAEAYGDLFGEDSATDPGFLLMTPLGMDVGGEEPEIRVTIDVDDRGCFVCGATVPEDEQVQLLRGEKSKLLEAAGRASEKALMDSGLESNQVESALIFSCVGRHAIYNDNELTQEEVDNVLEKFSEDADVVGLYGFGQIATTDGYARFNEETMVVQVIGQNDDRI